MPSPSGRIRLRKPRKPVSCDAASCGAAPSNSVTNLTVKMLPTLVRRYTGVRRYPVLREGRLLWGVMLLFGLGVAGWSSAIAQYRSSAPYPYSQQRAPANRRLPSSARHVGTGGLIGNPYRNDIPPSGLPLNRNLNSYYGGSGGNSLARRPVQKPFSNVTPYQPLVTSQQVARLEVTRGLWRY